MKKLTLLTTLTITLMFSPVCWGEWFKVTESVSGHTFYVDFVRIRQHEGYVYYWGMVDYLTPNDGTMSVKTYFQGDCEMFRFKDLSYNFYKESMGEGTPQQVDSPDTTWKYPTPDSSFEVVLKKVCDFVKTK
jgi:hypothetical protein